MVNWSFDDDGGDTSVQAPQRRRRNPSPNANRMQPGPPARKSRDGKVRKVINGEVVYLRVRRVVRT